VQAAHGARWSTRDPSAYSFVKISKSDRSSFAEESGHTCEEERNEDPTGDLEGA
jgi:hypothetical protein